MKTIQLFEIFFRWNISFFNSRVIASIYIRFWIGLTKIKEAIMLKVIDFCDDPVSNEDPYGVHH